MGIGSCLYMFDFTFQFFWLITLFAGKHYMNLGNVKTTILNFVSSSASNLFDGPNNAIMPFQQPVTTVQVDEHICGGCTDWERPGSEIVQVI